MISDNCITSRSAATRGRMFLAGSLRSNDRVVIACQFHDESSPLARPDGFPVHRFQQAEPYAPLSLAAASAAAFAPCLQPEHPRRRRSGQPPSAAPSPSGRRVALSCSAIRRIAIYIVPSDFAGKYTASARQASRPVPETEPTFTPALRPPGSSVFQDLETRRNVGAEIGRRLLDQRLLLGLHDVRQRRMARLVQAKNRP